MGTAILSHGFGVDSSHEMCSRAILLCLGCYMTTKVFIYYFLVERVFIIRRSPNKRMRDPLYLFNTFGMLVLNFYFRFAVYENGYCRIGMKKVAMIPLIAFDILVNVYLTSLFLIPIRGLYSYKNNRSSQVRTVAMRTFLGSLATLVSSVVNLTVVMVLDGEPGWICLMCCNIDILFSVLVLHWITSKDNASTLSSSVQQNTHRSSDNTPSRTLPRGFVSVSASEIGLSEYLKRGGVTTLVTAKEMEDGGDLERINSMPPNVITVESECVREVIEIGILDRKTDDEKTRQNSTDRLFRIPT
ncbi:hypothetical protein BGZ60DRAFT_427121 [Tricladium varicosporioides]|nr:hypothetical protein BGZ60DRAFT_427121 [Hymenoscyphus varicosporioides]